MEFFREILSEFGITLKIQTENDNLHQELNYTLQDKAQTLISGEKQSAAPVNKIERPLPSNRP